VSTCHKDYILDDGAIIIYAISDKQKERDEALLEAQEAGARWKQQGLINVLWEIKQWTPAPIIQDAVPEIFPMVNPKIVTGSSSDNGRSGMKEKLISTLCWRNLDI
jgi:hypothetical protein